jgi:glycine cleavage system H protein
MINQSELRYTKEHEWLLVEGQAVTVGITAYAAEKLGDVVFVDLPAVGAAVAAGRVVGEIESTKSVGELFAPVDGTVSAVNDAVVAAPELVNGDPFGEGWMIKIEVTDAALEAAALLSFDEYTALVAE